MNIIWLDNLNNLFKEKDIKIGEFEKVIGVSPGYFSRLKSKLDNGEKINISVSLLERISKEMGISIDMLINYEIPVNQVNLITLEYLIGKLITDTNERKIVWDEYNLEELTYNGDRFTGALFKREIIQQNEIQDPQLLFDFFEDDQIVYSDEYHFESKFDAKAHINGICYKGTTYSNTCIYIVPVIIEEKNGWELYMDNEFGRTEVFNFEKLFSTLEKPADTLELKVLDLVSCIKRSARDAYISLNLRNMIEKYMKE